MFGGKKQAINPEYFIRVASENSLFISIDVASC